jgi:hypothetical protein
MSLFSGGPVPPVLANVLLSEQKVEEKEEKEEIPKSKILVVHSKDVSKEELSLFKFHGKYLQWDDRYMNIDFDKLPPHDYLFVDMRERNARHALGAVNHMEYSVVCYVPWYHKSEKFIEQLSAIATSKFPLRAVSKEDFDRQLLNERLQSPSLARTFFGWLVPCLRA